MAQKPLMELRTGDMRDLHAGPSTGMNFYIVGAASGYLAVLQDSVALPLYSTQQFYSIDDLLAGVPLPTVKVSAPQVSLQPAAPHRASAIAALRAATVSPAYTGTAGAIPLVKTYTLTKDTTFYRYLSSLPDHRYSSSQLTLGTYLTSDIDRAHADTGFGAVGRYALPLPVPANHVIEYELPSGTVILAGTAAPSFGQAGGGVEICLIAATNATAGPTTTLTDY